MDQYMSPARYCRILGLARPPTRGKSWRTHTQSPVHYGRQTRPPAESYSKNTHTVRNEHALCISIIMKRESAFVKPIYQKTNSSSNLKKSQAPTWPSSVGCCHGVLRGGRGRRAIRRLAVAWLAVRRRRRRHVRPLGIVAVHPVRPAAHVPGVGPCRCQA